ncbi:MAG TPA: arsenite methyltransferase [Chloroflexia bacterium]|nr:arsenite methyltransferase [Chloroflexia bacterium]
MDTIQNDGIREEVRKHYGQIASQSDRSCCGTANSDRQVEKIALKLGYTRKELEEVPEGANLGLGCGNPSAIAALKPGEVVLDLGSGAGFDCFLAVRQVGETGHVIGVDMTAEMISKARANAVKNNYQNVEFRLGEIEHLPVADSSIDVIISNCVINLSPDKASVFKDAYRVLKPGGRLAISDIVATATLPDEILADPVLRCNCVAGAARVDELEEWLSQAGFGEISIQPKDQSRKFIQEWVPGSNVEDYIVSATVEARKPLN